MSNRGQLKRECGTYERRWSWLLHKDSFSPVKSEVKLTRSPREHCVICHLWRQNQDLKARNKLRNPHSSDSNVHFLFSYQGSLQHFQIYQRNMWRERRQQVCSPFFWVRLKEVLDQKREIRCQILITNLKLFSLQKYWEKKAKYCINQNCV